MEEKQHEVEQLQLENEDREELLRSYESIGVVNVIKQ